MKKSVFESKANQMGDFYVYYQKPNTNIITFGICTLEVNDYISKRSRNIVASSDEAVMWNWRYNSQLKIPYSSIKKMTPLSSVLKNNYG